MNDTAMRPCPVCSAPSRVTVELGAAHIRERLAEEFAAPVPSSLSIADYAMRQCSACELVFADPMRAGNNEFYRWVTGFPAYHAEARWEWSMMKRRLVRRGPTKLLELGCGEGKFLSSIADLKQVQAQGIDLSESAIAEARAKGLNVRRAAIEDIIGKQERFDVIVMSHVLEHVEDPLGIAKSCRALLNKDGAIFFSVPYSPTSREYLRLDIMNLPPHHLTRWNMKSLQRLAEIVGLNLAYDMREAKPVLKRAIKHTVEAVNGPGKSGTLHEAATVLTHPKEFSDAVKLFRSRERVDGKRAADEILVLFSS